MIKGQDESKVVQLSAAAVGSARLPYTIELWNLSKTETEKVVGQAASIVLARAIFAAAQTEHLGRRLVLRRGTKVLQESG
ncbi:hypothetical protein [Phenylobacterium sp.]|jgi:hypothetical protein|uniref:hypothetical protein n=1 Tax=Phenylobacterium sp. TaxID=1871053 RepID=UPI002F95CE4C